MLYVYFVLFEQINDDEISQSEYKPITMRVTTSCVTVSRIRWETRDNCYAYRTPRTLEIWEAWRNPCASRGPSGKRKLCAGRSCSCPGYSCKVRVCTAWRLDTRTIDRAALARGTCAGASRADSACLCAPRPDLTPTHNCCCWVLGFTTPFTQ